MRNLILIFIVVNFIGCDKSDNTDENIKYRVGISFSVINALGEDLLNPEHPNYLDKDKIKLHYLVDGEVQLPHDGNRIIKGFSIDKYENEYRIYIIPNLYDIENKTTTYIQWNEHDTDTLEVEFGKYKNVVKEDEIWLNGLQIWPSDKINYLYFILEK